MRGVVDEPARSWFRTARRPSALRVLLAVGLVLLLLFWPTADVAAAAAAEVRTRGDSEQRVIALTFDDGWHPGRCERIFEILQDHEVPATWFPNAVYAARAPSLWRRIAEHHPIANHTTHHRDLTRLSEARIRHEILSSERRIEALTGAPMVRLLRPPYGAHDARVRRIAAELGYESLVLWDRDTKDTARRTDAREVARAASRGEPGSIILMHCGPAVTPRILPAVIARYACAGYRFATVPELLEGAPGVEARVVCPRSLAGREWRLTEASTDGDLAPVDPGVSLTLRFGSRSASGLAGCVAYSVRSSLLDGGTISFDELRRDGMPCEEGAGEDGALTMASGYLDALVRSSGVRLVDGALELLDAKGRARLRFREAPPTGILGEWVVASLGSAGGEPAVPARRPPTVSFGPLGTLKGWGGCDTYVGGYGVRGEIVTIGPVLVGAASCEADLVALQSALLDRLESAATWRVEDAVLRLRDDDGQDLLELVPTPPRR